MDGCSFCMAFTETIKVDLKTTPGCTGKSGSSFFHPCQTVLFSKTLSVLNLIGTSSRFRHLDMPHIPIYFTPTSSTSPPITGMAIIAAFSTIGCRRRVNLAPT